MDYEKTRTTEIVERLVRVGNAARVFCVVAGTLFMAALLAVAGRLLVGPTLGWVLGFLGGLTGFVLGGYVASVLEATFEWMAQLLIEGGFMGRESDR